MDPTKTATVASSMNAKLSPSRPSRKRKTVSYDDDHTSDVNHDDNVPLKKSKTSQYPIAPVVHSLTDSTKVTSKKNSTTGNDGKTEEKRLRRYRPKPPQSYLEVKARALTQRLTVLSRERCGTDNVPEEKVIMAGSTGNVYTQRIGLVPRCDCPHAKKGNQCKHIIYVMLRVLKAKEEVAYQLALTSAELRELFKNAPRIPGAQHSDEQGALGAEGEDGNRKPIEGECPICYTEFELDKEAIVYCRSACGNNVHRDCMQSWMTAKGGKATCPYCRAEWEGSELEGKVGDIDLQGGTVGLDGYVNVASQLGLSGVRDYSSYHPLWVEQRFGGGASRRRYGGYGHGYGGWY